MTAAFAIQLQVMSKPPVVTLKPSPAVTTTPAAPREPEELVTLMGVRKFEGRFLAVEITVPVSQVKPLQFGNRKAGVASWMTARNQCDIEQRRRETIKSRVTF